jgi:hypothetical protein
MNDDPTDDAADVYAIRRLVDLGVEGVRQLTEALQQVGPLLAPWAVKARLLQKRLANPVDVADLTSILENGIQTIVRARFENKLDANAAFDVVTDALSTADKELWPESYRARWLEVRTEVVRLLSLSALELEFEAQSVVMARSNWIHGVRILSDVRPLFDGSGTTHKGNLLTNTLELQYSDGDQAHTIYFALDPIDLNHLLDEIEKTRKQQLAIESFCGRDGLPLLKIDQVPGVSGD